MAEEFQEQLKKSDGTKNGDLCAFSAAGRNVSVVHNGKEAIEVDPFFISDSMSN